MQSLRLQCSCLPLPRPSFSLQGVKELTALIFHKAQPKRMNNSIITGAMLAALTQAYVDALNQGAVPTIATAWQVLHYYTTLWCLSLQA